MKVELPSTVHYGKNIKRIREILGVKQNVLAVKFNITQQAISDLEKKVLIDDETLGKVAEALKVPVGAIKNFDDQATISKIINAFNDIFYDNTSYLNYKQTINQSNKYIEMLEGLLNAEQENNALLKKGLAQECESRQKRI